ncbi:hypothetical protein PI124_g18073 [Phytophthora idaei]|nr:hypothetical protein PI125_g19433 [Phytophthora idaei]KAG3137546.1 hypothetical protein PI126_g17346 [Phytophthora idaei]KAG3236923.1 hypothetical protein PI124_g18073 [Phytophthora idaei]
MSKAVIMAQIHMGKEAAYPQRQEIEEFKTALLRITINRDTRLLMATFKGRKSAQRWVNWSVPLGMRMLPLIDYELEREEAKNSKDGLLHGKGISLRAMSTGL